MRDVKKNIGRKRAIMCPLKYTYILKHPCCTPEYSTFARRKCYRNLDRCRVAAALGQLWVPFTLWRRVHGEIYCVCGPATNRFKMVKNEINFDPELILSELMIGIGIRNAL